MNQQTMSQSFSKAKNLTENKVNSQSLTAADGTIFFLISECFLTMSQLSNRGLEKIDP